MAKRVLYIEDEKLFAKIIDRDLTAAGYEVALASDGEAGLQKAREWQPNLILLDLLLPKMQGFDVLKDLKDDLGTQKIPVVVLTNLGTEADVKKANDLGAFRFFVKAMTMPSMVVDTVKEVIGTP